MRYVKPLTLFLTILLLYHLAEGWIWHEIGYDWNFSHSHVFGWLIFVISQVLFPILFVSVAYRFKPVTQSRSWIVAAWLMCWVPLMVSTAIDSVLFNDLTGYYHDYVLSHTAGWGETRTVGHVIVFFQWIWVTVFTLILVTKRQRKANT